MSKELIKELTKDLGLEGELFMGDAIKPRNKILFGIPSLDAITTGVPRGMTSEFFGNPSSTKTYLSLQLISVAQKSGIKCAFIDVEMAFSEDQATKAGVDLSELVIARPFTGEEVFELIEGLSEKGFGLIIVDSVASMVPGTESDNDYEQETMALQARLISKGHRKIQGVIYRNDTAVVWINQLRGVMAKMPGQKTTTTSGGKALGFYAGLRLELARVAWVENNEKEKVGMIIKATVEKNKSASPQRHTEFTYRFDTGYDIGLDILNYKVLIGEIEIIGRTYYLKDGNKKLGDKQEAIKYLTENK